MEGTSTGHKSGEAMVSVGVHVESSVKPRRPSVLFFKMRILIDVS